MSETTLTARIIAEDEASDAFREIGQAAKQMSTDVSSAGSQMGSAAKDIQNVGSAAQQSARESKSFGTSMASLGFGIASVGSSVVGLVRSFENISRAQDKATAANTKLESANIRVEKAQNALNQAIAKFGPDSQQAAQAAAKVELELRKQGDAANKAANATENIGFAWSNGAIDAVQFGAGIGQLVTSLGAFKTAGSGIVSALGGLGAAFKGSSGPANELNAAVSTLSPAFSQFGGQAGTARQAIDRLVSSFSGVKGGIGGAVSALGTLGAASATAALAAGGLILVLNEVGKATGDLNNQKTVFGTDVVIQFEDAKRAVDGFNQTLRDVISNIPGIGPAIASLNKTLEDAINGFFGIKDAAQGAGDATGKSAEDISQSAEEIAAAFEKGEKAADNFGSAFSGIVDDARKMRTDVQGEITQLQAKLADLVSQRGDTIDLDLEFDISKTQQELKTKTDQLGNEFHEGLARIFERQLPPSLVNFGQSIADSLPSDQEIGAMMGMLGQAFTQGGRAIPDAINFILTEMNEEWDTMPEPARNAVRELDFELRKLASLTPGTPAFVTQLGVVEQKFNDISGMQFNGTGLSQGFDKVGAAASGAVAPVQNITNVILDVPDDHVTTFNADTGTFVFDTQATKAEVKTVPTNWDTTFAGQATSLIGAAATGEAAIETVDPLWKTVFSGDATDVESKANKAEIDVTKVPDKHMTGFEAIGQQVQQVATDVWGWITKVPLDVMTAFTGQDVNAKSIAGGITAAAKPLEATFTSRFAGQDQGAGATASGVARVVLPLNTTVTSRLTAADQGASATAGTVLTNVKPINNRFTAMLEARDQGASQTGAQVHGAVKPINNRYTAMLEARDQASSTISHVTSGLAGIKSKTVQITVTATAGAGVSATLKKSLGLRHGGTALVDQPTNVRVGEGFKPEVVTVMPLTGPHAPAGATGTTMIPLSDEARTLQKKEERATKSLAFAKSKEEEKESAALHAQTGGTFAFGLDKLFAGITPKGGTATATAAVSMEVENKDTFQKDTQELGKAFGTTIPKEWNTEVTADTAGANASVTAYGRSINSIPKEKSTDIEADDRDATTAITSVKRALDTLPTSKTIKIVITSPAGATGTISFRHGGTSIISHPTNIRVGEGFHPELVSVVPLGKVPHAAEGGQFLSLGPVPVEEPPPPPARIAAGNTAAAATQRAFFGAIERVDNIASAHNPFEGQARYVGGQLTNPGIRGPSSAWEKQHGAQVIAAADQVLATFGSASADIKAQEAIYLGAIDEYQDRSAGLADVAQQAQETAQMTDKAAGNAAEAAQEVAGGLGDVAYTLQNLNYTWDGFNQWLRGYKTQYQKVVQNAAFFGAAEGFGPQIVRNPTMFLAGEAGPEMVSVIPMGKGTRARAGFGGGGGGEDMRRLIGLLERLMRRTGTGMEANLIVDGQRMANVAEKYIGTKSYGAR